MRSVLDNKHFYKKNDLKVLPKYFEVCCYLSVEILENLSNACTFSTVNFQLDGALRHC